MKSFLIAVGIVMLTSSSQAAIQTKAIDYEFEGVKLKGHLFYDDAIKEKRPGVIVVHEWWGLNDYAKKRAEMLAKLGYVGFACDMYGEGKVTEHPQEAGQMAGEVRKNLKVWQGRTLAAMKVLQAQEQVDPKKIAAIGYCFGGSTAIQLAFSGAEVSAVVSFHGALPEPTDEQAKATKAKILVCHGAEDAFIPDEVVKKFRTPLSKAGVDYQITYYAGAYHSFTVPGIDSKGVQGLKYDANADKRSWKQMQDLFAEVFGAK